MAFFNYAKKELSAKIVYYGPGLSGKTTNLEVIHRRMRPDQRGKLISLDTQTDRTLFFDFLPLELGEIRGFKTRFHIYTVPGQVFYNATRKVVLKGVDGVVFVADSQRDMMESNIQSLKNLEANLEEQGRKMSELPVVLQYNKRDLPNLLSIKELDAALNPQGWAHFEAAAISERGVLETLTAVCKLVLKDLRDTHEAPKKPAKPAGPKPQPKPRLDVPPAPPAARPATLDDIHAEPPAPLPAPLAPPLHDSTFELPPLPRAEPMAARTESFDDVEVVDESELEGSEDVVYVDDDLPPAPAVAAAGWAEKAPTPPPLPPLAALVPPAAPQPMAMGADGATEIVSWGQPTRISKTAVRVPIVVKTGGGGDSVSFAVTIDVSRLEPGS